VVLFITESNTLLPLPYLWEDGQLSWLSAAADAFFMPVDMDNEGVIVGFTIDSDDHQHAAVLRAGEVTVLDLGSRSATLEALNEEGMMVGWVER
jgi:hypothetical protein